MKIFKQWIRSLFFEPDWKPNHKCAETGICQETEGFKGTEHEGLDMCEDGCVQGKACWVSKFKR